MNKKKKIEIIDKIKEHIKKLENPNNLIITGDFNFVTGALDKSPPHKDNNRISASQTSIINKYKLIDRW